MEGQVKSARIGRVILSGLIFSATVLPLPLSYAQQEPSGQAEGAAHLQLRKTPLKTVSLKPR